MKKKEFLDELEENLSGLPREDIADRVGFYGEMIDDRIEDGLSEEEAVAEMGRASDVAAQIIADAPFTKIIKGKVEKKRALKGWEIAVIALGFPLWFPLLIAAAAVVFSVYIAILAVIISLWAVDLSLAASVLGGGVVAAIYAVRGYGAAGVAMLGIGLFCAGLAIFGFFLCKAATKGILLSVKKAASGIKRLFIGKERAK